MTVPNQALLWGHGWAAAGTWARMWAWPSHHSWAGLGCGELEPGPALASPRQGLMALGLSWGSGSRAGGGAPTGWEGQAGLGVPMGPGQLC